MCEKLGSNRQLALLADFTPNAVGKWLKGADPYEDTKRKIAQRTGVSLDWLRDGKGDAKEEIARMLEKAAINGANSTTSMREGSDNWLEEAVKFIFQHGQDADRRSLADAVEVITQRIERRQRRGSGVARYEPGSE